MPIPLIVNDGGEQTIINYINRLKIAHDTCQCIKKMNYTINNKELIKIIQDAKDIFKKSYKSRSEHKYLIECLGEALNSYFNGACELKYEWGIDKILPFCMDKEHIGRVAEFRPEKHKNNWQYIEFIAAFDKLISIYKKNASIVSKFNVVVNIPYRVECNTILEIHQEAF